MKHILPILNLAILPILAFTQEHKIYTIDNAHHIKCLALGKEASVFEVANKENDQYLLHIDISGKKTKYYPDKDDFPHIFCAEPTSHYFCVITNKNQLAAYGEFNIENTQGEAALKSAIEFLLNKGHQKSITPNYVNHKNTQLVVNTQSPVAFQPLAIKKNSKQDKQVLYYNIMSEIPYNKHKCLSQKEYYQLAIKPYLPTKFDDKNDELLDLHLNEHNGSLLVILKNNKIKKIKLIERYFKKTDFLLPKKASAYKLKDIQYLHNHASLIGAGSIINSENKKTACFWYRNYPFITSELKPGKKIAYETNGNLHEIDSSELNGFFINDFFRKPLTIKFTGNIQTKKGLNIPFVYTKPYKNVEIFIYNQSFKSISLKEEGKLNILPGSQVTVLGINRHFGSIFGCYQKNKVTLPCRWEIQTRKNVESYKIEKVNKIKKIKLKAGDMLMRSILSQNILICNYFKASKDQKTWDSIEPVSVYWDGSIEKLGTCNNKYSLALCSHPIIMGIFIGGVVSNQPCSWHLVGGKWTPTMFDDKKIINQNQNDQNYFKNIDPLNLPTDIGITNYKQEGFTFYALGTNSKHPTLWRINHDKMYQEGWKKILLSDVPKCLNHHSTTFIDKEGSKLLFSYLDKNGSTQIIEVNTNL